MRQGEIRKRILNAVATAIRLGVHFDTPGDPKHRYVMIDGNSIYFSAFGFKWRLDLRMEG